MDEPEGNETTSEDSEGEPSPTQIGGENQNNNGGHSSGIGGTEENHGDQPPNRWQDLGFDRKIELVLAGIIVLSSISQLAITLINNGSTGKQVDKIITAASGINSAATQIQQAGWTFSGAAIGINNAGWNAVGKLQDQASQVGRSADAAEKAVKTTQEQMRLDQRAWVGILGVDPDDFSKTNGFPVTITFSNSGRTPAGHVTFSERYIYSPVPIPGPPDSEIRNLTQFSAPDIAPQGRFIRRLALAPSHSVASTSVQLQGNNDIISHFDSINDGGLILYYFGTVTYDDIFRKPHITDYCIFVIDPKAKTTGTCDTFNNIQ